MPAHATKKTEPLISLAEQMLARRFSKGEVKRLLRDIYAKENKNDTISPRTLESIISEARRNLVASTDKNRDQHREDSYRLYDSVLRSRDATIRDKVKAQAQIDRLLGLQAPLRHLLDGSIEHTGGVSLNLNQLSDGELETLERLASRVGVDDAATKRQPETPARPRSRSGRKSATKTI
jgi:hypothetical protein